MKTKIVMSGAVALLSLTTQMVQAATTTVCAGTAGAGTAPASGAAGTNYMMAAITPKCSANVQLQGKDGTNGSTYAVAANSAKGKNTYAGSTSSGGIGANPTTCAVAGGCTMTEVATALGTVS